MKVAREGLFLLGIGVLDLGTTLFWVASHGAQEANPIFRHYLDMGPFWMILMKMVCLVGPIFLLEWVRRRKPRSALRGYRMAIAGYLLFYVVGVARLNPQFFGRPPVSEEVIAQIHLDATRLAPAEHTYMMPASAIPGSTVLAEGMR